MNNLGTSTPYCSFLICRHPDSTQMYLNGRPIGEVRDGKFTPAQLNGKDITMRDLAEPFPFHSLTDMKHVLTVLVQLIEIDPPAS